jgi:hypothetical protein
MLSDNDLFMVRLWHDVVSDIIIICYYKICLPYSAKVSWNYKFVY